MGCKFLFFFPHHCSFCRPNPNITFYALSTRKCKFLLFFLYAENVTRKIDFSFFSRTASLWGVVRFIFHGCLLHLSCVFRTPLCVLEAVAMQFSWRLMEFAFRVFSTNPRFCFFFSIRLFFTAARMCSVYVLYWSLCLVGPLVANKRAVRYSRWERKWNVESYSSFVWPRRCVARNDIFLNRCVCRRPTKTNFARIEFYAMFFRPLAKTMSWHSP